MDFYQVLFSISYGHVFGPDIQPALVVPPALEVFKTQSPTVVHGLAEQYTKWVQAEFDAHSAGQAEAEDIPRMASQPDSTQMVVEL